MKTVSQLNATREEIGSILDQYVGMQCALAAVQQLAETMAQQSVTKKDMAGYSKRILQIIANARGE